ncbi:hypothetical protein FGB62_37g117 [Gracilaria domingensis]|nr:hypothetical protein FGB62_37g117 [Gracilaria domingensis]
METNYSSLVFEFVGIATIFLTSVKELISNWNADYLELKEKRKAIKVAITAILSVYNAFSVTYVTWERGFMSEITISSITPGVDFGMDLQTIDYWIPTAIFGGVAVAGIMVGATEDYYKRYSRARPHLKFVGLAVLCLTTPLVVLFVLQGNDLAEWWSQPELFFPEFSSPDMMAIVDDSVGTIGKTMRALAIVFGIAVFIIIAYINKLFLRISLVFNVALVPVCILVAAFTPPLGENVPLAAENWEYVIVRPMILYTTYTFPALIISELFVLALISKQRKREMLDGDEEAVNEEQPSEQQNADP